MPGKLCCHRAFSFLAVLESLDLKQHLVKATKNALL